MCVPGRPSTTTCITRSHMGLTHRHQLVPPLFDCRSLSNDINYLGGQQASHLRDARVPLARPVALPPELAQLQHLRELAVVVNGYMEAIPPEWAQPGAFPSLTRCVAAGRLQQNFGLQIACTHSLGCCPLLPLCRCEFALHPALPPQVVFGSPWVYGA